MPKGSPRSEEVKRRIARAGIARWAGYSKQKREAIRQKHRDHWASLTPEQRRERAAPAAAAKRGKPNPQHGARMAAHWANLSPEERAQRTAQARAVLSATQDKCKGEKHHLAKLTAENVRAMREAHAQGASFRRIARAFGVNVSTAHDAVKGKTWPHV
jgi:hypothetical protein